MGYRAAAVAGLGDLAGLGIDAELNEPLPPGVEASVTSARERERLRKLEAAEPGIHWGRLPFSAKESVYQAWFPLTGRWLGFEDADLTIDPAAGDPAAGSFAARSLVDGARRDGGRTFTDLSGLFTAGRGLVVTAVTVPRD